MQGLFLPSLQTREYTLGEKVGLWRGKLAAGVSALWNEQIATELSETLPDVDVPVYLLHGKYDCIRFQPVGRRRITDTCARQSKDLHLRAVRSPPDVRGAGQNGAGLA